MKISHFSVNRPVAITMLVITILILGMVSFTKLNVDLYPELVFPIAIVATSYDGAAPQEVETLISRPLEGVLGTVENVKQIQSVSRAGASQVIIEFNWGTNMDFATLTMREKIDMIKNALPDGAGDPLVIKIDPAAMSILTLGISGGADIVELKNLTDDTIIPRLERVAGVASVGATGGKKQEIHVVVDSNLLNGYGLTLSQVTQTLMAENSAMPGGDLEKGLKEMYIRLDNEYKSIDEIAEVNFQLPSGGTVKLKDFATIQDSFRETKQITRLNGVPSIEINVYKQTDGNTVKVANQVSKALEELKKSGALPDNVAITPIFDQSVFIKQSIESVVKNMIFGGVFALIILYLFMRSLRSTLVIGLAMPFAVIATFTMLYFSGQTLNMMTLGGLALGIGMMVDSSIVVLENIFRHRQMGKNLIQAAKDGASEVGLAVLAGSFTTIGVFLPIVFVDGMAAQFFRPLGLTVSISIFAALIVSLTLVPMLASRLLRVDLHDEKPKSRNPFKNQPITRGFGRMIDGLTVKYSGLLRWSVGHRKTVLFITTLLFIGAAMLVPFVGAEFMPAMDTGELSASVTLPKGTLVEETERVTSRVEELIYQIPEVDIVLTSIGSGGGMDFSGATVTERGRVTVKLVPLAQRERSTAEVVEDLRQKVNTIEHPDAVIEVSEMDNSGGPPTAPLEIRIQGNNFEVLNDLAGIIAEEVKLVEGTRDVKNSLEEGRPELLVKLDRERLARYGISTTQIMSTVRTAFQGQVSTQLKTGEDEIDVRVILPEEQRRNVKDLEQLVVRSQSGAQVALHDLVSFNEQTGPSQISRRAQVREVTITSNIYGRDLGSIVEDIRVRVDNLAIPEGYFVEYGGQSQDMAEAFGSLLIALVLAIVLVYIIMAAQFEAFTYPFIIMFSVPVTFIGVVVGLFVTGRTLSVTSFIGLIMLAGIVVNNAIVLVDYINRLRAEGMERDEAIIAAGPVRLRPILMTTLTTVLALVPLAIGIGEGSEGQAPMATVVVFGLTFSTLITLVLIPVVYTLFDDLERKLVRWFGPKTDVDDGIKQHA
ncbi:multidrug ABC transporter [Desulfuribacillus stibiiarsenatis]|uniref:Multidrug ABC transporter n=1 Tax=Desulfuribacillus stibiiarsenatis TaxID=1390249 RepID=A0A1E5L9A5_9FIRM|nr:efflux RND transporter permease subunit [Desulfuribacillus stibiiarsenatis]OEH86706.1 multidrug ABC transporter [Desulfuribacillus stibiiarsenatis]